MAGLDGFLRGLAEVSRASLHGPDWEYRLEQMQRQKQQEEQGARLREAQIGYAEARPDLEQQKVNNAKTANEARLQSALGRVAESGNKNAIDQARLMWQMGISDPTQYEKLATKLAVAPTALGEAGGRSQEATTAKTEATVARGKAALINANRPRKEEKPQDPQKRIDWLRTHIKSSKRQAELDRGKGVRRSSFDADTERQWEEELRTLESSGGKTSAASVGTTPSETFKIRNSKTGEIKLVTREQLLALPPEKRPPMYRDLK